MNLSTQRRLAAEILGVGENRIWIDPTRVEDIASAISREEIRRFIKEGAIKPLQERGISRGRIRARKGKRKRAGSRKGSKYARLPKLLQWPYRIRALRRLLRRLRDEKRISKSTYRKLYRMAKGGAFKSKAQLIRYLESQGLMKKSEGGYIG